MVWPLTIIADRYGGLYSRGAYLAWNLDPEEIPGEVFGGDLTCGEFWDENPDILVGRGDTPGKALADLELRLARGPAPQEPFATIDELGGALGTKQTKELKVLLLIDVQAGFLNEKTQGAADFLRNLLEREHFDLVIQSCWKNYEGSRYETELGYRGGMTAEETAPALSLPGATLLWRSTYSAVNKTLLTLLRPEDRIFVAGLETDACVLATLFSLWDAGFSFRVYEKGVATPREDLARPTLELIRRQFGKDVLL